MKLCITKVQEFKNIFRALFKQGNKIDTKTVIRKMNTKLYS